MKISKGKKEKKMLGLIYGVDGVGKSSLGAQFPNPLFIGPENGTSYLDVARFEDINDWSSFIKAVDDVIKNIDALEYKTIVIDSLDWVEPLIHQFICKKYKVDNLAHAAKGFGAGFKEAFDMQVELKNKLKVINQKKHVLLIAHSQVTQFNDPLTELPYDRYELKLHQSASVSPRAMWREFVDFIFFINSDVFTSGDGKEARASDSGIYLHTKRTPSYDAKRRVEMPDKIKFEKSGMFEIIESFFGKQENLDGLFKETLRQAEEMQDEELRKEMLAKLPKYKNDKNKLLEIQKYIEGVVK